MKDSQSKPDRAATVAVELITERQDRPHAGRVDARDHEPGGGPVRGERRALHLDRGAMAALVLRPAGGRGQPEALRSGPTISSGASRTSSRSSSTCGRRCRTNKVVGGLWPNDGDGNAWGDAASGSHGRSRLRATRSSIPVAMRTERRRGLLGADRRVQEGRRRDPDRRPDPARLHDLLDAGAAAGVRPQDRVGRQGAALPIVGRGPGNRRRRRECRPRSGGARAIHSSRR